MSMYRAGRLCATMAVAVLALAGCGDPEPAPGPGDPPATTAAASTSASAAGYDQSDVDAAILPLTDPNLSNFHAFTFPDPAGGMPARSDDCLVRWLRQHRDQRESATFSAGRSYAETDEVGPFVIQSAGLQPGTGAKDLIAAQQASYAGPCQTWPSASKKVTYVAAEDTTLGTYGEQSWGYKVTATSPGGPTVVLLGMMIRKGGLLSTVEYAGSPTANVTRAKAVFAAAAKLLPQP